MCDFSFQHLFFASVVIGTVTAATHYAFVRFCPEASKWISTCPFAPSAETEPEIRDPLRYEDKEKSD